MARAEADGACMEAAVPVATFALAVLLVSPVEGRGSGDGEGGGVSSTPRAVYWSVTSTFTRAGAVCAPAASIALVGWDWFGTAASSERAAKGLLVAGISDIASERREAG